MMPERASPLRVGLIVDSAVVPRYVYDLAEWGQKQSRVRITHVLVQGEEQAPHRGVDVEAQPASGRRGGVLPHIERGMFGLIVRWESSRLRKAGIALVHEPGHDLTPLGLQSLSVESRATERGAGHGFSEKDVGRIRALGLDVLVMCGAGTLRGGILTAARFGILSFLQAGERIHGRGPAGFWDVCLERPTTAFVIRRQSDSRDSGEVVVRGNFPTKPRYLPNAIMLLRKGSLFLKQLLSELADSGVAPAAADPQPDDGYRRGDPTLSVQLRYLLKVALEKFWAALPRRLGKKSQRWAVAYSREDWNDLVMSEARTIDAPPNHFLADPFVIEEGGRDYCFVEDYDCRTERGCIAVYALDDHGAVRLGEALIEPFHLSFPYVFRFEGKLYMCPETYESKEIRLYECAEFPLKWELSRVLMRDVSAADSMIFERDGVWWLLTNIDRLDSGEHCSELFAFSATDPRTSAWTPHPGNPLVADASKARNGGLLVRGSSTYRVAQRQGFDAYGIGFSIQRISTLTGHAYREEQLCTVEPQFFPGLVGTHHMHSNGRFTVFDFAVLVPRSRSSPAD
jgi:hypothetical protein